MGFGVLGLGFTVLGFRVLGLGLVGDRVSRVGGLGFGVEGVPSGSVLL